MKSGDEKVFNLIADKLEEINYSAKVFELYLAVILSGVTIAADLVVRGNPAVVIKKFSMSGNE